MNDLTTKDDFLLSRCTESVVLRWFETKCAISRYICIVLFAREPMSLP